ncbi:hypothetical protein [Puniceicoccus vermicola]|uniref:Uncharacterized protein n=1 Tax=Puniceicoccus vermicola TaxID=388746 RepID=A0A7X1AXH5_9BACT|nr:hypothetical protein [Puniceicoccus vermicola]MBC2600793.1 hypothetical protein [Puniceicoccus vermicola]
MATKFLAAGTPLASINADDLVPGETPPIQRNWGRAKEDIWRVDNLETYDGTGNCLLFDRQEDATPGSWGVGLTLPSYNADWLGVRLAFKFEGSATEAKASLEVRTESNNRLYYANIGSSKGKDPITLVNADGTWKTKAVNYFDREVWNRITWFIPTALGETQEMRVKLEHYDRESEDWIQVGKIEGLEIEVTQIPMIFRINFPANTGPIQLRFDDLVIITLDDAEMASLLNPNF